MTAVLVYFNFVLWELKKCAKICRNMILNKWHTIPNNKKDAFVKVKFDNLPVVEN